MRRFAFIVAGCVFLASPVAHAATLSELLLAQVAALKSQITALQEKSTVLPGVRVCAAPQRTLGRDDTGDDVANLQIFLRRDSSIYPEGIVSGYYGPATERAVQRWQKAQGIVSSGSPSSTGYGLVGAKTRAALQQMWICGGAVSVGWFSAAVNGDTATFSAQASSTYPLDTWPYIETGDGATERVEISNVVCKTASGPCSSVLTARHTYAAGSYTAKLIKPSSETTCLPNIPSSCSLSQNPLTLGVTTVVSSGVRSAGASSSLSSVVTGQSQSVNMPPAIRILAPTKGASVLAGGSLTISWTSSYAPASSTVSLVLKSGNGATLGYLVRNQRSVGTYWWALPVPAGATCSGDILSCLSQIAAPACVGDICSLAPGSYSITAQLISGAKVVASVDSGIFTVSSSATSFSFLTATSGSVGSTGSSVSTSASTSLSTVPGSNSVTTPSASCLYSGVPYVSGITLQVSCTDLAGVSCGSFGMMSLTCRSGTWVDGSGNAANVPGITTPISSGVSCTTPWGGQKVLSGQQITYEPFFTGGQYTGSAVVPLMQCTQGQWQKCAWDGTGCVAYTAVQ